MRLVMAFHLGCCGARIKSLGQWRQLPFLRPLLGQQILREHQTLTLIMTLILTKAKGLGGATLGAQQQD